MSPAPRHRLAGRPCLVLDSVDSTNTVAWEALGEGISPGFAVLARGQTAGRGREGRAFHAPAGGGLWASLTAATSLPPSRLPAVTVAAAVAAAEALEEASGLEVTLRWPNDLMLGDLKTGGVIAEARQNLLVVGIGINLALEEFPADLRGIATSAALAGGGVPEPEALLASILPRWDAWLEDLEAGNEFLLLASWKERCRTLGRAVTVQAGNESIQGILKDLSLTELVLETAPGTTRTLPAGHVTRLVER